MNKQREVVYSQRKFILAGADLKPTVFEMVEDVVDETVRRFTNEKTHFEDWDITALSESLYGQFGVRFDFATLSEADQTEDGLIDHVIERVKEQYEKKEAEISSPIMRELEKFIMLQAVDSQWKDHLLSMDHLKEGIGLRGYGQRDPLKEYQKEGYDLFLDMSFRIKEETVRNLLLVKLAMPNELEEMNESREKELQSVHANLTGSDSGAGPKHRTTQKIGRNAPCPCGSGKKYKKCCGK
jgi:preprotein translocase subunit SecA